MNSDRRVYKSAAKRLAKEIGRLMADALVAEAKAQEVAAKELRGLAAKLSAVLEGLRKQLDGAAVPLVSAHQQMTEAELVQAFDRDLPKLDPGSHAVCRGAFVDWNTGNTASAVLLLSQYAWQAAAVPLANRVIRSLTP